MVIVGDKTRLAVECDGDAWHGPDAYERDLARQRDLERCGWRFFRIRESEFYADRPAVLARLWDVLHGLDIHPSGWTPAIDNLLVVPPPPAVITEPEPAAAEPTMTEPEPVPVAESPAWPTEPDDEVPAPSATQLAVPSMVIAPLATYDRFEQSVVQVGVATRRELVDGLARLVEVEGPVMGGRLHTAYVRASGAVRVTKQVSSELNKAISQAVREGLLVEDNPLGESGIKPRTYRLPGQPAVRLRQLGPRSFDEIPPAELAALVDLVTERDRTDDTEALQRAALELLGLKRLTDNVRSRFTAAQSIRRVV